MKTDDNYRNLRLLGWASVLLLASTGVMNAAGVENVMAHINNGAPNATEALEDYQLANLQRIFFAPAKSALSPEEKTALTHLVERSRLTHQCIFELRGYNDSAEAQDLTTTLSNERAEAIARFLIQKGVPPQNIRTIALGEIEGGSASNPEHRRVDVRVFIQAGFHPGI